MDPLKANQFRQGFLGMKQFQKSGLPTYAGDPVRAEKQKAIQQYTNKGQAVPNDVRAFLQEQNLSPDAIKMFTRQNVGSTKSKGKKTASRKQSRA
jgi:hypothetical protein